MSGPNTSSTTQAGNNQITYSNNGILFDTNVSGKTFGVNTNGVLRADVSDTGLHLPFAPLEIVSGGTNRTTLPAQPTASSYAAWDSKGKMDFVNPITQYTSLNSNGTVITYIANGNTNTVTSSIYSMTSSSTGQQFILSGSSSFTIELPITSTIYLGESYYFENLSANSITLKTNNGGTFTNPPLSQLAMGSAAEATCISISGTGSASEWSILYTTSTAGSGTVTMVSETNTADVLSVNVTNPTTDPTINISYSGTPLEILYGGTQRTTLPTTATASSYAAWDQNKNFYLNNEIMSLLQEPTSSTSPFQMDITVAGQIEFTGSTASFVTQLPDVSGLYQNGNILPLLGYYWYFLNEATVPVQISTYSGTNLILLNSGDSCQIILDSYPLNVATSALVQISSPTSPYSIPLGQTQTSFTGIPSSFAAKLPVISSGTPTYIIYNLSSTNAVNVQNNGGTSVGAIAALSYRTYTWTGTGSDWTNTAVVALSTLNPTSSWSFKSFVPNLSNASSNTVLTGNGSGQMPTWQTASSAGLVTSVTTDGINVSSTTTSGNVSITSNVVPFIKGGSQNNVLPTNGTININFASWINNSFQAWNQGETYGTVQSNGSRIISFPGYAVWDQYGNITANNFCQTVMYSAFGQITGISLSASSPRLLLLENNVPYVVLPKASTIPLGTQFQIVNQQSSPATNLTVAVYAFSGAFAAGQLIFQIGEGFGQGLSTPCGPSVTFTLVRQDSSLSGALEKDYLSNWVVDYTRPNSGQGSGFSFPSSSEDGGTTTINWLSISASLSLDIYAPFIIVFAFNLSASINVTLPDLTLAGAALGMFWNFFNPSSWPIDILLSGGSSLLTLSAGNSVQTQVIKTGSNSSSSWSINFFTEETVENTTTTEIITNDANGNPVWGSANNIINVTTTNSNTSASSPIALALTATKSGSNTWNLTLSYGLGTTDLFALPVANGGTGRFQLHYIPLPSTIPSWDTQSNLTADNLYSLVTTTTTSNYPMTTATGKSLIYNPSSVGAIALPDVTTIAAQFGATVYGLNYLISALVGGVPIKLGGSGGSTLFTLSSGNSANFSSTGYSNSASSWSYGFNIGVGSSQNQLLSTDSNFNPAWGPNYSSTPTPNDLVQYGAYDNIYANNIFWTNVSQITQANSPYQITAGYSGSSTTTNSRIIVITSATTGTGTVYLPDVTGTLTAGSMLGQQWEIYNLSSQVWTLETFGGAAPFEVWNNGTVQAVNTTVVASGSKHVLTCVSTSSNSSTSSWSWQYYNATDPSYTSFINGGGSVAGSLAQIDYYGNLKIPGTASFGISSFTPTSSSALQLDIGHQKIWRCTGTFVTGVILPTAQTVNGGTVRGMSWQIVNETTSELPVYTFGSTVGTSQPLYLIPAATSTRYFDATFVNVSGSTLTPQAFNCWDVSYTGPQTFTYQAPSSSTTITMTDSSEVVQILATTATVGITYKLPGTGNLSVGQKYEFINANTTYSITIQTSTGASVCVIPPSPGASINTQCFLEVLQVTTNVASAWNFSYTNLESFGTSGSSTFNLYNTTSGGTTAASGSYVNYSTSICQITSSGLNTSTNLNAYGAITTYDTLAASTYNLVLPVNSFSSAQSVFAQCYQGSISGGTFSSQLIPGTIAANSNLAVFNLNFQTFNASGSTPNDFWYFNFSYQSAVIV